MYDVIVVGGSYGGLSAALQVARARRNVAVIDAGVRRNRFAEHAHGLLGHDGVEGGAIVEAARTDLKKYPTVTMIKATAVSAQAISSGFEIVLDSGESVTGKRVILALGVIDKLPDIPGLQERWGQTVFHCPYCHAYEISGGDIGVLATGPMSVHTSLLLPDWGLTTYFTRATFEPNEEQLAALIRRGVTIERAAVTAVEGNDNEIRVLLEDGRSASFAGVHVGPKTRVASPLAEHLGCAFDDGPLGAYVRVDAMKETTVPGVFACGDMSMPAGNIAVAVGDGARTGSLAHRSLVVRDE